MSTTITRLSINGIEIEKCHQSGTSGGRHVQITDYWVNGKKTTYSEVVKLLRENIDPVMNVNNLHRW